jgi:hypothetical protein
MGESYPTLTIGFSGVALIAAGAYVIGTGALLTTLREAPHRAD